MFIIDEVVVENSVAVARFACDLQQCHGACCTLPGGRGAPLTDDELAEVERAFPIVRKYLSPKHLEILEREGLFEGYPGSYALTCVDDRDCAFVYYDDNVARCSFEKARLEGEISWRKPVSCHLFPIRESRSGTRIHYEQIRQCAPGVARGEKERIPLFDFLRDALVRRFGIQWYEKFREECLRRTEGRT